jgi:hypothetical protein
MTQVAPTAFACTTAGVVLHLTLLPPRVPLLSEVQLPILLRFLERLLQLPCQICNRHSQHIE